MDDNIRDLADKLLNQDYSINNLSAVEMAAIGVFITKGYIDGISCPNIYVKNIIVENVIGGNVN